MDLIGPADRLDDETAAPSARAEDVARIVAHDLNNLLSVISVSTGTLVAGDEAGIREAMRDIGEAVRRAKALTAQLVRLGSAEAAGPEQLDLGAVLAELARLLQGLAGPAHRVMISIEGSPHARAARSLIEQAVMNLVTNARDALPAGGTIRVRLGALDHAAARAAGSDLAGDQAVLEVQDHGVGMTPDTLRQVFRPFFTTKPSGKGTGLGLPSVLAAVRGARGCVRIDSAPDRGTTVRLFLPAMEVVR